MLTRSSVALSTAVLLVATSGMALAGQRSAADQALYEKAVKACNGPQWPNGARPFINYSGGWFRCVEPRSSR